MEGRWLAARSGPGLRTGAKSVLTSGMDFLPFSTRLLSEFITFRTALLCYWGNIVLLGVMLLFSWRCASRGGLVREGVAQETVHAVYRRIYIAQALYAFGALLCVFNTYASIALIVAVQIVFVVSPSKGFLSRL